MANPLEIFRRRQQEPPLEVDSPTKFAFLFKQLDTESKRRITQIVDKKQKKYPPICNSVQTYQMWEHKIIKEAKAKRYIFPRLTIILVTDIENCKAIIYYKTKTQTLHNIKQIFLCHPSTNKARQQAKQLREQCSLINRNHQTIGTVIKIARKTKETEGNSNQILKNFIFFDRRDYQQSSYIEKIRIVGCLNLAAQDFEQYRDMFEPSLDQDQKKLFKNQQAMRSWIEAERLYKQKKMSQYSQEMLSLYQQPGIFYQQLNKRLLSFMQKQFPWRTIAFPICLMHRAIKFRFQQQKSWPQYKKLFGDKDYCYLSRVGLKSDEEIDIMRQKKESNQSLYLEFKNYVSTSISERIALDFIDRQKFGQHCLIRFKLKKPTNQQQKQRLSFIYQTFAILRPLEQKDEQQVLLNLLSVAKFIDITDISCKEIQEKYNLKEQFKNIPNSVTIPLIDLQVGYFRDELLNYKAYLQKINQKRAEQQSKKKQMKYQKPQDKHPSLNVPQAQYPDSWVFRNYIMTADSIKKQKKFDIGCSLKAAGNLQDAYDYDKKKLQQLQKRQSSMNEQQQLDNLMQMHQKYNRLASTCIDLHHEQKALQYITRSISNYKKIEGKDERHTFRQHQEHLTKMIQQEGSILKKLDRPQQAIKKMKQAIEQLNMHAVIHPQQKQLCQFLIAQRQMVLGTIIFKMGNISEAQNYVEVSKMRLDRVYAEIGYEQLKKQTFFFGFILYFLKCLLTGGQMADKQKYFQSRRAQNISQATFLFGGRDKFNKVQRSSIQLVDEMKSFIQTNQLNLVQDENGNLLYAQFVGQDRGQIGPDNSMPIAQKMEKQFENHPQFHNFKQQSNKFFRDFIQKILEFQNSFEKHAAQKYKAIVKLIFLGNRVLNKNEENIQKIQALKDQIIDKRLEKWDQIGQDSQFDQTAIEMKIKIESIVLEALEKIINLSNDKGNKRKSPHITHQLSNNIAQSMERSLKQRGKWGFLNPTQPILKHYSTILKFYEKSQDIIKQLDNVKKMLAILQDRPDLIQNTLDGYLLSINLHYKMADFDFIPLIMKKINIDNIVGIMKHQDSQLSQCQHDITTAFGLIQKYKSLLKSKENNSPRKRKGSIIRNKRVDLLLDQNKISINNKLQNFEQNVKSFSVQLSLWKIKIYLYKNEVNKKGLDMPSRKLCQKQFQQIEAKIMDLRQHSQRFNQSFFKQMFGVFQFAIIPPSMLKRQLDNKLRTIAKEMKEAMQLAVDINERGKHLQILIRLFLMFLQENYLLIEDLHDLLLNYSRKNSDPSYWKVYLVMSFLTNDQKQKMQYIDRCLEELHNYKEINKSLETAPSYKEKINHFAQKYQLMSNYKDSQLRKTQASFKPSSTINAKSRIEASRINGQRKQEKMQGTENQLKSSIAQQASVVYQNRSRLQNFSQSRVITREALYRQSLKKKHQVESTLRGSSPQVGQKLKPEANDEQNFSEFLEQQPLNSKIEKKVKPNLSNAHQEAKINKQQRVEEYIQKDKQYYSLKKNQSSKKSHPIQQKSKSKISLVDIGEIEKYSKVQDIQAV